MKKAFKLVVVLFLGCALNASAQKMAHINSNDLMLLMPERKQAETSIQEYAKQMEGQMKTLNEEYQGKVQDYQAKEGQMTDIIKKDKEKEIVDLEERIKNFQQTAQEALQKKEQELLTPMMEKAKKAINEVAKEGSYKYIFDTATGVVLYSEPSDDILPLVKKKLGIDPNAVPPSQQKKAAPAPAEKK